MPPDTAVFLEELRRRDIQVRLDGARLHCNAPAGALTPGLREELRRRKGEILEFLHSAMALAGQQRAIVPLQPHGERTPVFAVAGHSGDPFCYRALVRHLGDDQPFFGLQPPGLDGQNQPLTSVEDLAAYFAGQIRAFRPNGPYVIAGYCAGGTVAFELARQMVRDGAPIRFVALFGSPCPAWYRFLPQLRLHLSEQAARLDKHARALLALPYRDRLRYIGEKLGRRKARLGAGGAVETDSLAARLPEPALTWRIRVEKSTLAAVRRYTPRYFAGHLAVFLPSGQWRHSSNPLLRWRSSVAQSADEYCGPDGCDGDTIFREPHVSAIADLFRRCRDKNEVLSAPWARGEPMTREAPRGACLLQQPD